jgi:ATP-dependent DNA ligase
MAVDRVPLLQPMPLAVAYAAFSHPVFELKWDGFRSLAYIGNGRCRLVSRNWNDFKSFPKLANHWASPWALALPSLMARLSASIAGEASIPPPSSPARGAPLRRLRSGAHRR